jgi:hypothetical protein
MADKVIVSREKLVAVADAVREKTGGTESLTLDEMPGAVAGIEGAVSFPGLPEGYARCGYIQFTDAQIVDTGIICSAASKIRVVFMRELDASHYMFGVASSGNTASVTAYLGGSWRFGNKSANKSPYVTTSDDFVYTGILDSSQISITNSKTAISGVSAFETVGTLLLGSCRNSDGTLGTPQFQGKIFQFEMWSDSEQVLNLLPVVSFEGVYRFWDSVSGEFFDSITEVPLAGGNF